MYSILQHTFIIFIALAASLCYGSNKNQQLVERLVEIRQQQRHTSYKNYKLLEQKAAEIKREAGSHIKNISSSEYIVEFITHAVPPYIPFFVFLLLWWYFLFSGRRRLKGSGFYFVLISIVITACWLFFITKFHYQTRGIVNADTAVLRLGPDSNYPQRIKLTCTDEVDILHREGSWYKVSFTSQRLPLFGWIHADHITLAK
jgi:hypothetical protein